MYRLRKSQSGVSIVELLAAVVVIGILLTITVPGMQSSLVRNQVRNEAIRLMADIQYARSEAVKRHEPINLCRSKSAGDGCTGADCDCINGLAQRQWDDGWLIYTASAPDTSFVFGTNTLLRAGYSSPENVTVRANETFNRWISVKGGTGALEEADTGRLAVCMDGESTDEVPGMLISVNLAGRPALSEIPAGGECDFPPVE